MTTEKKVILLTEKRLSFCEKFFAEIILSLVVANSISLSVSGSKGLIVQIGSRNGVGVIMNLSLIES